MKGPLKVAFTGCGLIGQWHHIPSLVKIRDTNLVAICDTNEALVKETARRFKIDHPYTNYSDMIKDMEPDMVDIATPPQTHYAFAMEAIEASCHVLSEKPMGLNVSEVDEMTEAARKKNVMLCEIRNKRFEPVMMKAVDMVNRGDIGEVTGITIQIVHSKASADHIRMNKDHWCHSLPAGVFTESLPHPIYLAATFLGKLEKVSVFASGLTDNSLSMAVMGEKGIGTISFSCNSNKSKNIIDIYGTRKHLHIDLYNSVLTQYGAGTATRRSRGWENLRQGISMFTDTLSGAMGVLTGTYHSGHYTIMNRFVDSILNGTEPPVTMKDVRGVMEVLDEVTAQIKAQRHV
jgi:predicted dehydrogenase